MVRISCNGNRGGSVVFKWNKVMEVCKPSAALACVAWLLQSLEQRHAVAHTRYRERLAAFRKDAQGKRRDLIGNDTCPCRKRVGPMLGATQIGMTAVFLLLLSLMISTLDAVFKADWLKLFGAPANMLRLLLLIPAAILVIMENPMSKKRRNAALADLDAFKGQAQAGTARQVPERRTRARCGSALLAPHGA